MLPDFLLILSLFGIASGSSQFSNSTIQREKRQLPLDQVAVLGPSQFNYLRCWRCDYDDKEQCVKNFDFTKHKHEACDGKCLKAFQKVEARTKAEIDKDQLTPTIRKCVSQKEMSSLHTLGINTKNGCHDIRTAKRSHKLYCFCENDLCNTSSRNNLTSYLILAPFLIFLLNNLSS